MTDDLEYALEDAGNRLATIQQLTTDARVRSVRPAPGSPAAVERDQGPTPIRSWVNDVLSNAHLRLTVAEEHLAVVGQLVAAKNRLYPMYPLVRSGAELAARTAWILEPGLSVGARLGRHAGDRLDSLKEQRRLVGVPVDVKRHEAERRRRINSQAARAGVTPEPPPSGTRLLSDAWSSADTGDSELGALTFQLLSAFSHGTLYALYQLLEPITGPDGRRLHASVEGEVWARMGTTAQREATGVLMAIIPYQRASRAWMQWTGKHDAGWTEYLRTTIRAFRQFVPDESEPA